MRSHRTRPHVRNPIEVEEVSGVLRDGGCVRDIRAATVDTYWQLHGGRSRATEVHPESHCHTAEEGKRDALERVEKFLIQLYPSIFEADLKLGLGKQRLSLTFELILKHIRGTIF